MRNRIINGVCAALIAVTASAQDRLDITLVDNGQQLEVRVRPESDFNGLFSSLVFTLRCDADVDLGDVLDAAPDAMNITASATPRETGWEYHQVFTGFGFTPLSALGMEWQAGEEHTLCTIAYTGSGAITLVNDDHTASVNGDYYVSINGLDRTGIMYETTATGMDAEVVTGEQALSAWPNPTDGPVLLDLNGFGSDPVEVYVHDATGKLVLRTQVTGPQADIDLGALSSGTYVMRAHQRSTTMRVSLVVH